MAIPLLLSSYFPSPFLSLYAFSTFRYVNCEKRALKRWKILNHFARRAENFYFYVLARKMWAWFSGRMKGLHIKVRKELKGDEEFFSDI